MFRISISLSFIIILLLVSCARKSISSLQRKGVTVTQKQVEDIAKLKMPDLNAASLEAAVQTVKGTARSMGLEVV